MSGRRLGDDRIRDLNTHRDRDRDGDGEDLIEKEARRFRGRGEKVGRGTGEIVGSLGKKVMNKMKGWWLWSLWLPLFYLSVLYRCPELVFIAFLACLVYFKGFDRKKEGDLSAYSVFNPGHSRILGTLNSDSLDSMTKPSF